MLLLSEHFSLPVKEPILLYAIILLVILLAPLAIQRLRIPGIIGLILAGALIGPHGLRIIEIGKEVELLATVGILYIMFWAGLEIDLAALRRMRQKSILFGLLTYSVPLGLGILVCLFILKLPVLSAILLASMFSTHTLIAYPIVHKLGLQRREVVTIAIGGTIITDTLALLTLAVITQVNSSAGDQSYLFWLRLLVGSGVLLFLLFWVLPRLTRFIMLHVEQEVATQFIFTLAAMLISGFLAELAGLEPIIGAFFAGLSINAVVPHQAKLREVIEFTGNTIFIPVFLLKVGMLVQVGSIFNNTEVLWIAGILTSFALISKAGAAWIAKWLLGYSRKDGALLFGLSSAHAAATIAIILIGIQQELLNYTILNATILLILVTCIISSLITDRTARSIVAETKRTRLSLPENDQRILVPYANPQNLPFLIEWAMAIEEDNREYPIFPLSVIVTETEARQKIRENAALLEPILEQAKKDGVEVFPVHRIDINPLQGITSAASELLVTEIVIGWNGAPTQTEKLFGTILDKLVAEIDELIFVCNIHSTLQSFKQVTVVLLPFASLQINYMLWIHRLAQVYNRYNMPIRFIVPTGEKEALEQVWKWSKPEWVLWDSWETVQSTLEQSIPTDDFLVLVSGREGSITPTHNTRQLLQLTNTQASKHQFTLVIP